MMMVHPQSRKWLYFWLDLVSPYKNHLTASTTRRVQAKRNRLDDVGNTGHHSFGMPSFNARLTVGSTRASQERLE
jgi:hypothetical protein